MALILVASSLVAGVSRLALEQLALQPAAVIEQLKLWQLVTPTFLVPLSPLSLIFGIIIVLQTGSWLEDQWGRTKLWVFVVGVNVLANLGTVLVGFVSPSVSAMIFFGGYTTIGAMWIAQGLIVGPGRLNWFGFPVSGYAFAVIGAAFTLLSAVTGAWFAVVPQLLGIGITVAWVQGYTPSQLWLRFRSRQLERDLRKRASHLSIIDGKKSDRDQYLN
ncbi:MAG: rhomboid family intramembrane serine protease [Myxococcaceae bacterium]